MAAGRQKSLACPQLVVACFLLLMTCMQLSKAEHRFKKVYSDVYKTTHCKENTDTIVFLMEWKWTDIAKECTDFLGPRGFCAVQVSPPNENKVVINPNRPWWERYQPVSYKIDTRSGNEDQFKSMVEACNKAGVRVYVDIIMNHMAQEGNGNMKGTGGSSFDARKLSYPAVPYTSADFNDGSKCSTSDGLIHNWANATEVRNCRTLNLPDLNQEKDNVKTKLQDNFNHFINLGVAGFRINGAKFLWPSDIEDMLEELDNIKSGGRPFIYQDIEEQTYESIVAIDYLDTGKVTNYKFGAELQRVFRKQNPMKYLNNWGPAWNMWPSREVVNFLDNQSNQRGTEVLTHRENKAYKMANAFMLAHPYGMPRVMSSYNYAHDWEGPPHFDNMSTKSVPIDNNICGYGWVCEHRWRQIYNMVAFRNVASGTFVRNWWSGSDYQIAFSRGEKAFIALNLETWDLNARLKTGLTGGDYCDVISGGLSDNNITCTGVKVSVSIDGYADIKISSQSDDPIVAIHTGSKIVSHLG